MTNLQSDSSEVVPSLGEQLRRAREALGLSLEAVSEKINLRASILQRIENNEFIQDAIPATFMKGYVRNYAKFLKLPDNAWEMADYGEVPKNDLGKNSRAKKAVNSHSSHGRWVSYLTWLILLIVIGMTLLWWWENHQQSTAERDNLVENYVAAAAQEPAPSPSSREDLPAAVPETPVTIPAQTPPLAANPGPSTSAEALQTEMNRIGQTEVPPVTAAAAESPAAGIETESAVENPKVFADNGNQSAEGNAVLRIEVTGSSCWISVRDGNRKVLAEKEYRQGEVLTFDNGDAYSLIIGAPGNVKISYKGQDVPLKVDGRVARFKLPAQ